MPCLNDFRILLKGKEYLPLMVGGMGVNISTAKLVLAIEKLGGIAHLSDAMLPVVTDRELGTQFTSERTKRLKFNIDNRDKTDNVFELENIRRATMDYVSSVMEKSKGAGLILINCMEKLTMNQGLETLKTRLNAALDAGISGITLSAGLHLSSFKLMQDNPRFHDALFGIIVSSSRALNLFLKKSASTGRLPDYIVVEGPLAGGHLGFGDDWMNFSLENIVKDVKKFLAQAKLNIPVFAAGGIFSGGDATHYVKDIGADGVQVATRFTVACESGLPTPVKEAYLESQPEDVVVNHSSPTGYPMRMLKYSPSLSSDVRPNCESYGYLLNHGKCQYLEEWQQRNKDGRTDLEKTKCCLCTHMRNFKVWTCGTTVSRLKEKVKKDLNGKWILPTAEEIWNDYRFGS